MVFSMVLFCLPILSLNINKELFITHFIARTDYTLSCPDVWGGGGLLFFLPIFSSDDMKSPTWVSIWSYGHVFKSVPKNQYLDEVKISNSD